MQINLWKYEFHIINSNLNHIVYLHKAYLFVYWEYNLPNQFTLFIIFLYFSDWIKLSSTVRCNSTEWLTQHLSNMNEV